MRDTVIRKTSGMMAQLVSDLSANFEKLGVRLRKQLAKTIISQGGPWVSIAFLFSNLNNDSKSYGNPKLMLASFKNDGEFFKRYNYFLIRNEKEAAKICKIIKESFKL
jgi:hypothetical protein